MKSASIPQVRVEPELRAELEAALHEGESLSQFVETAVRSAVEYRRVQAAFHARGQAAWEGYLRGEPSVPAQDVVASLQKRLDAKRKQLLG